MNRNVIVFEGATLEEARKKLFSDPPRGLFLQSETAIPPKSQRITAVGDSTEQAFAAALAQQPEGMTVSSKKEISSAGRTTVPVDAWDREAAAARALKQAGPNASLESLTERRPPKEGFLGIGKAPGKYEAVVFRKAAVEVHFSQAARIEATFGARITTWAGLIHHIGTPGTKFIDELGERLGYQFLFILHERETASTYYDTVPFGPVPEHTIEKSRALVHGTQFPGILGKMVAFAGASLQSDRYDVRPDGNTARKTNAVSDMSIVSVASCLPKGGNLLAMSNEQLGTFAFQAITHYAKIPLVRYFLGLSFSQDALKKGPLSPSMDFDWRRYLGQLYSGGELLLLEVYDELPDGGLITDEIVVKKVRSFFQP
jgi:hypothetical protein